MDRQHAELFFWLFLTSFCGYFQNKSEVPNESSCCVLLSVFWQLCLCSEHTCCACVCSWQWGSWAVLALIFASSAAPHQATVVRTARPSLGKMKQIQFLFSVTGSSGTALPQQGQSKQGAQAHVHAAFGKPQGGNLTVPLVPLPALHHCTVQLMGRGSSWPLGCAQCL